MLDWQISKFTHKNFWIFMLDNIALFNGFLCHTGDYDSRQFIISRGGAEGDNELCENHNPQYGREIHCIKQLSLEGNLFPFNCAA